MSEISATTRRELVQALAERYRSATVHQKRHILDEFVAVTGYHRKRFWVSTEVREHCEPGKQAKPPPGQRVERHHAGALATA